MNNTQIMNKNLHIPIAFFWKDIKRAVGNLGFFIAIFSLLIIFLHAVRINTNFAGSPSTYEIISVAMALSGFTPFAAIFPVLGYSARFCDEYRSGYLNMMLGRMGWKQYGWIRILTTGISGGMVIAIPIMVVCIFGYIVGVPGIEGLENSGLYYGTRMWYYLEEYGDWYILIGKTILGFLFGALWAIVGLAFSVWFYNRYVTLLAPFILYEMMWILLYKFPVLNPIFLLRGDDLQSYPLSGFMELVYLVIAIIVVWLGLKRRVQNA